MHAAAVALPGANGIDQVLVTNETLGSDGGAPSGSACNTGSNGTFACGGAEGTHVVVVGSGPSMTVSHA